MCLIGANVLVDGHNTMLTGQKSDDYSYDYDCDD